MSAATTINGEGKMKISEKALLDGYDGITNGGNYISKVKGDVVFWNYRVGQTCDGFNCVTTRDDATEISLENDRVGTVKMTSRWDKHNAVKQIKSDENKLWGDELR
jgi:hypothetical protein